MPQHSIEIERHVAAPPEAVWTVVTDLDRASEVMRGIIRLERIEGEGYAPGTRWRETRKMFGKEATEEMYVTEVEEPRRTVVEADGPGVHYVTTFGLEPSGAGTRLTMSFGADQAGGSAVQRAMMKVFGSLGMKATRKMCEQDLADIAAAAEAR